jgi:hypothetical protein
MIRDAIEKVQELAIAASDVKTILHKGRTYSTRGLHRVPDELPVPEVAAVKVATLRSLAQYITDNPDKVEEGSFLNVVSPTRVELVTPVIGEDARRKTFAVAEARLPKLQIGAWLSPKDLGVHLRTCFVDTDERNELVAFVGQISDKAEVQTKDDGVAQATTVRTGLSMLKEGTVPSPVTLAPFRTFHDVEQPDSPFIFRLDKQGEKVVGAIFEADGGAWQHDAAESVAEYLREHQGLKVYA